jgi:hypothetical protein
VTAPASAPTTSIAGQTSTPFVCAVTASITGTSQLRRLIVSVPAANRDVAWVYAKWSNSSQTTAIDLSRGRGQAELIVNTTIVPDVFVFESPNLLGSELGCSFTP